MNSSNTAIVILAAGNSARMGSPKQLLNLGGRALIRHAAETAIAVDRSSVIVVLGARAELIRPELDGLAVEVVENPNWEQGMGTSIQAGVRAAKRLGCSGAILMLADQPFVTSAMLDRLIEDHRVSGKPIVTSEYAGTVGVPVFFAASHLQQLLELKADQGCKGVILKNGDDALRVSCPEAELDIDTPSDYERLVALAR